MMAIKDDIDDVIKGYLLARGFSKTAAELDEEINVVKSDDELLNEIMVSDRSLSLRILSTISSMADTTKLKEFQKANCRIFFSNYDAFRSWAFDSLDVFKTQYVALCLPIFVHW